MLLLGIDIGTSSIKVSVVDSASQQCLASAQYPDKEVSIISHQPGWAEQSPETWWEHVQKAILRVHSSKKYNPLAIGAIGIAYQMHGMVVVDKQQNVLRDAIIWCDSRAVAIGEQAFAAIGPENCFSKLLNSPGNFTASKLAWVKKNEPAVYEQIDKVMLPGDFISMKLTGEITTNISSLSEGIFWDFETNDVSADVMNYFGFNRSVIPSIRPVFSIYGELKNDIAQQLSLKPGIPVSYKAGDQPNNALSLNVLNPGEVAATAGTSGVIYGVSDELTSDPQSRVNPFAHVNYTSASKRLGVLLCINGTGIINRWTKDTFDSNLSYAEMNEEARQIAIGSDGLKILPFGNGAERMLNNRIIGAHIHNINLNKHTKAHIFRATQEGIAFAFRYGLDIMRSNGMHPQIIKAGMANLFLSELFTEAFVNATGVPVELYKNDGSIGAALGAGIGVKAFASASDAFTNLLPVKMVEPTNIDAYESAYQHWEELLNKQSIDNEQKETVCQQSF
ncbi:xylulokinase [Solitalea koreensis]|uniref:Xylulokinase n=1 Tax=Solitalea koreensis TaxID=543615 RepID=A0A521DKI1_9SPHI|nr:FGGY family carbohydrate kinase [Solitalea koreensis]SMO72207.1 xylulokinase [Solitalea koreensis]